MVSTYTVSIVSSKYNDVHAYLIIICIMIDYTFITANE